MSIYSKIYEYIKKDGYQKQLRWSLEHDGNGVKIEDVILDDVHESFVNEGEFVAIWHDSTGHTDSVNLGRCRMPSDWQVQHAKAMRLTWTNGTHVYSNIGLVFPDPEAEDGAGFREQIDACICVLSLELRGIDTREKAYDCMIDAAMRSIRAMQKCARRAAVADATE